MPFQKGYTPWNKGKKCSQISKSKKGKKCKPFTREHLENMSKSQRKFYEEHTEEHKGTNNPMYGKKHTKEAKRKIGKASVEFLSSGSMLNKKTKIERKIEKELKKINLIYESQVPICKVGVVDFFLPDYDIIIECDGDYWHNRPKEKQRDVDKDLVWMFNGYKIFRFWEHEINESPKKCINKVLRYIRKIEKEKKAS